MILQLDCEKNDAQATFMHPDGPAKSFIGQIEVTYMLDATYFSKYR